MSKVLFFPRKMTMEVSKARRLTRKNATHLLKTLQVCCACHTERLLTRYETCCDDTKCHACRTKRSCAKFEHPEVTTFAALSIGTAIAQSSRMVADGCQRLQTVQTVADGSGHKSSVERTPLRPQTPKVKREPFATHSGTRQHLSMLVSSALKAKALFVHAVCFFSLGSR